MPEPMRCTLPELATRHQADKWNGHWYAQHYERHLKHLRDEPITLLEIGVGGYGDPKAGGASLKMWRDWFSCATIAGMDIAEKHLDLGDRIRVFQGDQSSSEDLNRIVEELGGVDVVVDDGSHVNWQTIRAFEILFPLLSEHGLYIIEDLQTSYWKEYGGLPRGAHATAMGHFRDLCDGLNHVEYNEPAYSPTYFDKHIVAVHFYHNLCCIEKGHNDEARYGG